ncbi:MAG: ABC transporter ATP-binding protein/permease [Bacilli bacterium]|nr:ABC transporter ATP-binding protein/permease [Bacilli bacterium]
MLEIKKITKTYVTEGFKQKALDKVSINFRKNEFASILGPSGSGKTTLLNVIGGLDHYDSGDLIINETSTKKYKDRDWDSYRNHRVGFVFQSYNLIAHQSVLSNVELALTLSGVSKKERRKRSIKALEKVGLKKHINKKPSQLSGGQMQRVAIARALVNDPEILLADEPTGALDSETSRQVMEILKEVAQDRLVIMVTHNPDIAKEYSTRIVKLKDGKIIDDSNPYDGEEDTKLEKERLSDKSKKTSMSLLTALSLSLNNLMTKKGRTFLTAFAGSIGIIGIALILSISTGVKNYINKIEEDTLSSYPISIEKSTVDMSSITENQSTKVKSSDKKNRNKDKIYSINIMNQVLNIFSSQVQNNNLKELKKYIESTDNDIKKYSNSILYGYDLELNLYKDSDEVVQVNPSTVLDTIGAGDMIKSQNSMSSLPGMSSSMSMASRLNLWNELIDNERLLKGQYKLLAGKWPEDKTEVVLIVNEDNEISDYALYTLGIKDQSSLKGAMKKLQSGEEIKLEDETSYSYDDLLDLKFKLILNSDYYKKNNGIWEDKKDDKEYMKEKIKNADEIKVVGILKEKGTTLSSKQGGIGYLSSLKEYTINKINESEVVKEQRDNPDKNVFTGLDFPKDDEKFDYSSLSNEQKMYLATLSQEEMAKLMEAYSNNANASYDGNMNTLGAVELDNPSSINIYPKDFDSKEKIGEAIDKYNKMQRKNGNEDNEIVYSDLVGNLISSVSSIVDVVSYVLIAFVTISLIVSSIMIAIITYISVLERTKEIGILRAIGASKKDITRVFNAETIIEGFAAGILGIVITLLISIPVNIIVESNFNVEGIASLPFVAGLVLVLISAGLTVIAGLIPSRMAAKKDPVEALRSE